MSNTQSQKKGFTLVETLVAVSILLGAIITPMVIASQGIAITTYARDQVIAAYLAQDAVEYIIAKKKQNTFDSVINESPTIWLNGLYQCEGPEGCTIDTTLALGTSNNASQCSGGVCPALNYNTVTGAYGHQSGADWISSRFTRKIYGFVLDNPSEAVLVVIISWKNGATQRSFTLKTNIYETIL